MSVTVVITQTLDDFYATDEEFAEMSNEQIIELAKEDVHGLMDGANWQVVR